MTDSVAMLILLAVVASGDTKTDLTKRRRLHYSLGSTLSAHFRRSLSASELLHLAS